MALLVAAPAETWPEVVALAPYLIRLFTAIPEAQSSCYRKFIADAPDDLAELCDRATEHS
jgi:hypothetical protein